MPRELDMSFPASDPPAATQPGSDVTGPEVASSEAEADRMKDNRLVYQFSGRSRVRRNALACGDPERPPKASSG